MGLESIGSFYNISNLLIDYHSWGYHLPLLDLEKLVLVHAIAQGLRFGLAA